MSSEGSKKIPEPRVVSVRKTQVELGVQICGGNLCGIFVENLEEDSPAKLADVLMPGDMILEVSCPWSYKHLQYSRVQNSSPRLFCSSPIPISVQLYDFLLFNIDLLFLSTLIELE